MALPASGQIDLSQVSIEVGQASTYSASLDWVRTITKDAVTNMDSLHGRSYYQSSMDGNCDNGNCAFAPGAGDLNCVNCSLTTINCVNCDTQPWLQAGTNCVATYNCNQNADQPYNCNCNCNCNCACFWSDDTLKDRQGEIVNALDIICELTGFYYTGNDKARQLGLNPKLDVGVSAQDIERVFPVAAGDPLPNSGVKTVRYERLVPLLLEAVKSLNQKVNQLENKA